MSNEAEPKDRLMFWVMIIGVVIGLILVAKGVG